MITVYSEEHAAHAGTREFHRGKLLHPCFEAPERVELILKRIRQTWPGEVYAPDAAVDLQPLSEIHDPRYIHFVRTIHGLWPVDPEAPDALPHVWSCRTLRQVEPESIYGKLGYYSFDAGTPITAGTWKAAIATVKVALTAQKKVWQSGQPAFALTRPPGHHAARDLCGGYCFFNNAAIAAQAFLNDNAARVAILDVDYHHGNGTQAIFYERKDVLFISLHGDPKDAYPYFLGYRDETGESQGKGFTVNYPLPPGTDWELYRKTLLDALGVIEAYRPACLIISLGVDTYEGDKISDFKLRNDDFLAMGELLGSQAKLPTLFVMEGGYYPDVGVNVVNVLSGFRRTCGGD